MKFIFSFLFFATLIMPAMAVQEVSLSIDMNMLNRLTHVNSTQAPQSATLWVRKVRSAIVDGEKQNNFFKNDVVINTPDCFRKIFKVKNCDYLPFNDEPIRLFITGEASELDPEKVHYKNNDKFKCSFENTPAECKE